MKSNTKKRLIAFMLCMVLVLSSATSAFADEPQNTDSQSQAEVVTEPVADEATGDEANTTDIEIPSEKEWSVQVGNATVKVKGSADALPENAQLSVSEITSEDEVKEIEKAVEEKAIEEQFSIKNIFSYDIKFLVDGTEVQPTTPVQVSVDTPEITSDQNAAVLHVDDNNVAEDMNGAVDGEGKVVFDAPHFSKYVIVQKGDSEVTVTIEHYDNTKNPQEKIYADDVLTLPIGGKINDYTKATNWNVESVKKVEKATDGTETTTTVDTNNELSVTKDCTIKVYYTPKTKDINGDTTFYDYTVKAVTDDEAQKNNNTYYSFNMLGENPTDRKKLTAGTASQNYDLYNYWIKDTFIANGYTGSDKVVKGILKGLDKDGKVEFNYPEPGFFEDSDATCDVNKGSLWNPNYETRYLRKVYKDLKLGFEQSGDTYTLKTVKDTNGNVLTTEGSDFYPLDNTRQLSYERSETAHNYFFGMRYDVPFKIGDYVGPMNYEFTGDDDLWVLLDGELILDLGGIHKAASGTVDIWQELGKTADQLTPEEKEKEHTLTVLYMERGAGESNCKMKFTLPSASIAEVSQVPMAELNLQKVNKNNEGLQGARFTLVNNETGEPQTASSVGESGNVKFSKLRVGTYTLREDVAPSGYIPSLDTWIVKVELDSNNTAIATLYLSDGTTPYTDKAGSYYHILNMTKEELINSSLDYNKTAKVIDWDKRTYQIDITAASKLTSTTSTEQAAVADVMMVFDTSGSMLYNTSNSNSDEDGFKKVGQYKSVKDTLDTTKVYYYTKSIQTVKYRQWSYENAKQPMIYLNGKWIYYNGTSWNNVDDSSTKTVYTIDSSLTGLKEAASTFTTSMAASSTNSRIGIATFNYVGNLVSKLTTIGTNKDELVKKISSIYASAGMSPQLGLELALTQLEENMQENVPRYVILFTDGAPSSEGDKAASELQAQKLKEKGITVYTIGLKLNEDTKEWLEDNIASKGCAYPASSVDELKTIFKNIQTTITHDQDMKNAQIKDVIDPRFVILDDSGNPITSNYSGIDKGITLKNGGTVYYDKTTGNQYIVWNEQTIPNSKNGNWNKSITVKAKDDYIGGNDVPTNISPDSMIHTGYGDAVLPQPKVNVKAELKVKNKEVTIYKGDSLPDTNTVLKEMFDLEGNTSKYNVPESSFTTEWYSDPECTTKVTDLTADTETTYYLKVSYDAGVPSDGRDGSTANTGGNIAGGTDHIVEAVNENDSAKLYGIYTIKVVSGEIQITKKLESALETECTFNFSIKDESGSEIKTVAITIPAGSTEVKLADKDLKNLPRGTYTISEVNSNGYVLTNYQVDETTNCRNTRNERQESVTFKLGYETNADSNGKDVDVIKNYTYDKNSGGTVGSVTFTNVKATKDWDIVKVSTSRNQVKLQGAEFELLKNNTPVYIGTSNDNGKIIWKKGEKTVTNLAPGEYVLRETKAPVGYVRSEETWSLSITKGGSLVSYTSEKTDSTIDTSTITESDSTLHLYFKNETAYALPSAGGTGIYLYMIGGMLLMFAAAWILYKNKCREVLEK
ncbi:SpaA isopeptide-forming pilin-related protein [Coprococcus comes]|uniref:SpaA isopeptide-forming pilin-related protein n=2 Tax=Coprococcus comes TaxID=410072 RepID=UPI001D073D12|nr:SpaA isopeptide-forming pilin-related protein [Coprococcus comes]MCB6473602.1 VWA domain-containing protein [Coprococcus comes]